MSKKSKIRENIGNATMQALLKEVGVRNDKVTFEFMQSVESAKSEYEKMLLDLDYQQVAGRYRWEGLPDYITSWQIENMLYYRGSLIGFFNGGELILLPYATQGGINVYGLPTKIKPLAYNGGAVETEKAYANGLELIVDSHGGLNTSKAKKGALLFDRLPMFKSGYNISYYMLTRKLRSDMAEILARIKNNIKNADKKIVFYCDSEAEKTAFYNAISESYTADDPFIVMVRNSATERAGLTSEPLHTDVQLQAQELFESFQSLNNLRCQIEGIGSGDVFEKKERKITGELNGQEEQTAICKDVGLYMRKLFITQLAILYPEYKDIVNKITVYRVENEDEKCYNNDSKEDENNELQNK